MRRRRELATNWGLVGAAVAVTVARFRRRVDAMRQRARCNRERGAAAGGPAWPGRGVLVVALPMLALVTGCAAESPRPHDPASAPASTKTNASTKRYTDPAGWSLVYPRTMHLERSSAEAMVTFSEVTLASFQPRSGVRARGSTSDRVSNVSIRYVPPVDASGRFPGHGVAFRMQLQLSARWGLDATTPESRFPIEPQTFQRSSREPGAPARMVRTIEADGQQYTAIAWIGRDAPQRLRAALARMIASLSFPHQRPGSFLGDELAVLQPASSYPAGSFTLVDFRHRFCGGSGNRCRLVETPFYLVHAPGRLVPFPDYLLHRRPWPQCRRKGSCVPPGAFYAIGWTYEDVLGGYRSRCDLRLERTRKWFYCTNLDARWDRVGRVITKPAGFRVDDSLQYLPAKVAWDGHVVVNTAGGGELPSIRQLWPGWHPRS